ncbi:hypothetical protein D6D05_10484, partial [Aureobasidium pullulans]
RAGHRGYPYERGPINPSGITCNKTLKGSPLYTLVLAKWLLESFVTKFIRDNLRIASIIRRPIEAARLNGTHLDAI